jgi:hypothetical protein
VTTILVPEALAPAITKALADLEQIIAENPDEARKITKKFNHWLSLMPTLVIAGLVETGDWHENLPAFVRKDLADPLRYYRGLAGIDKTK